MPNLLTKIVQKAQRGLSPGPSRGSQAHKGPSASPVNAVYYPNWAVYRGLPPSSLDLSNITHIVYAFVWPNADGGIEYSDLYADKEKPVDGVSGALRAITQLKSTAQGAHVKVLLSVGGGGRGSSHFSALTREEAARSRLAAELGQLVREYGFDGLDVDWEHPENNDDRANYLALLRQLRHSLPAPDFLLTAALPAPASLLQHVPLSKAAEELDFLFLMAYDFSGPWSNVSGHHAQLHGSPICGADAVQHLRSKGVASDKIVLGVPAYGRFFPGAGSVDRPYTKPANEEEATVEYRELPRLNAMEWIDEVRVAAYSVGGDGFISFDNVRTVTSKAEWVKEQALAGLFYWTILGDKPGEKSLVQAGWKALNS